MRAFHNNPKTKEDIIAKLNASYQKGSDECSIILTVGNNDYSEYETRFGIPQILARLEDEIFHGLLKEEAKIWPISFMGAIPVGADLSDIWRQFAIIILSDPEKGVLKLTNPNSQQNLAISKVIELYQTNSKDEVAWSETMKAAEEVGKSLEPMTRKAYEIQEVPWEKLGTWGALKTATWAAASVAEAAAWSSAWSVAMIAAGGAARRATREAVTAARVGEIGEVTAHYLWMAERLLDLLRNAPVISETSEDPK